MPPFRLFALPSEETVTSRLWPGRAKAGRLAVTSTAATFFSCSACPGGRFTPSCASIAVRLCVVNGVCAVWSPLPSRPTTSP